MHDFRSVYRRLEVPNTVFLFQILQFLAHQLEIVQEALLAGFVLRGDVGLAEHHQVVDVVAGLKQQTAYGRVGHFLVGNDDGAHVQSHKLLHVFHLLVHRELHLAEDFRNHLFPDEVMVVESPSRLGFPAFRSRFADVVEQGRPAQPQVVGHFGDVVHHFQGMVEIILVSASVAYFHSLQSHQLRENQFQ